MRPDAINSTSGSPVNRSIHGIVWALALSGFVLILIEADAPVPVFANPRVLWSHLICSSILAATMIPYVSIPAASRRNQNWMLSVTLAVGASFCSMCVVDIAASVLQSNQSGFLVRLIVRSAWTLALCFLWLLSSPFSWPRRTKNAWSPALFLWLGATGIFSLQQKSLLEQTAVGQVGGMRVANAFITVATLCELDSRATVGTQSAIHLRKSTLRKLRDLERDAEQWKVEVLPIEQAASASNQQQHAMVLMALGRNAQSLAVLEQLPDSEPQVWLLRALAARELQQWRRVEQACREVLSRFTKEDAEPAATAYQLLAEACSRQSKSAEAIACLKQAIEQCEPNRPDFELRLGLALGEAGRKAEAIEHLQIASKLEPTLTTEAHRHIARFKNNSCNLRL